VPPRIRNYVEARDRGRCQAPGCRNRGYLQLHHEGGWRRGHDPDRLLLLCDEHHRQRHRGELQIEGNAGEGFRFSLANGACVGRGGDDARAAIGSGAPAGEVVPRPVPADQDHREAVRVAVAGLRRLGESRGAADEQVRRALESEPGRQWTDEDLLLRALQLKPIDLVATVQPAGAATAA